MSGDNKIRIGFIGSGGNARHHMGTVLGLRDVEIAGLTDPNPAMLEAARRQHPALAGVPGFANYRDMLAQTPLDAVEISTPHTTHYQQIVDCLAKGLHVLCEKPLVCTVAHAHDVIERRTASGKVGLLSYQRHYQPEFRYIREQIATGAFGPVTFVSALQCQGWKHGTAGSWRQDPALSGGGQLNDSGSHLLDIILWVTGLGVEKVSAFIDNCGTPVDINSALTLTFRGGAQGNISVVGDAPSWHEDLTIWCENGFFLMRNGHLAVCDGRGNRYSFDHMPGGSSPDRNFVDAIRGRDEVQAPFECGLRVIELTEAAWKSAGRGGAVINV
ncbi:MAG: Gfo/Idh/MocA family oxidoreductase [Chthonomonadales bacterium]|nr:Gfo/Idh/MocA family oxidoreductase [Chthonomonadales bacterium]